METVLITGGTGMVGRRLTSLFIQSGYKVIWVSRKSGETEIDGQKIKLAQWNIADQTIDKQAIEQADHIIHLAGAGVAEKRWTAKRKGEILDSRTKSSALIVKALKEIPNNVQTVVCASAIGWYGPDEPANPVPFTEDMPPYPYFLGDTCKAWEESIDPVAALGKRLVKLRIGIVLSKTGGAIPEFEKPLQVGLAAIFGTGKQMVSWIHIADLCRLFLFAIKNKEIKSVFNAVAPVPVSNRELILTLARHQNGKFFIPVKVPAFILRWMLGEMSIEILKSTTVSSKKIEGENFQFNYTTIEEAVRNL